MEKGRRILRTQNAGARTQFALLNVILIRRPEDPFANIDSEDDKAEINGEALLLLVEDFSEFSSLVSKALKFKKFLRSLHPNSNTTESDGASASGVASTKEVICSKAMQLSIACLQTCSIKPCTQIQCT